MSTTAYERFEKVFGPGAQDRDGLPANLRRDVYARMLPAFAETDGRKLRRVKTYFMQTFHPDPPFSAFTRDEREAVFVTIPHIFEGEKLS